MAPVRTIEEYEARQIEVRNRIQEIDTEYAGQALPDPVRAEWNDLDDELKANETLLDELRFRKERVDDLKNNERNTEAGTKFQTTRPGAASVTDIFDLSTIRASSLNDPVAAGQELRERAQVAIDRAKFLHPIVSDEDAKTNVERLLQRDSEDGRFARYILATGSPTYKRAWPKLLVPNGGGMLSADERAAVESVQRAERALNLTGAQGGFAVPFELDPTILATSDGVVNPIRQLARVEQITVDEWRGVSTAGITASYAAEMTETTDNSPTLVQPTVSTEKAQAFIPFSIEIGMDWPGLQPQMSALLQDAKDTLEADKFVTGTGTNEPYGIAVGTTNTVNAATGADAFTLANLYTLVGSLPPRYRSRAAWIADLLIMNRIRQFETTGGSLAAVWVQGLAADLPPTLLGKSIYEASAMPDDATTGKKFLIIGDFKRYLIADRIGLTVDLIPHLFGDNNRPIGARGIYAYWRNGAKVIDANAFRALIGTA
jgi:HK97 family phage major capsid protein